MTTGLQKGINSPKFDSSGALGPPNQITSVSLRFKNIQALTSSKQRVQRIYVVFPHGQIPSHPSLTYGYDFFLTFCVSTALQEGKLKLSPPQGSPSRIFKLMVRCWAASPKDRLSFSDICAALSDLPSESKVWEKWIVLQAMVQNPLHAKHSDSVSCLKNKRTWNLIYFPPFLPYIYFSNIWFLMGFVPKAALSHLSLSLPPQNVEI